MMRYKLPCKVPTGPNFVVLDVKLEWSENPVLYGHSTVLTLKPNMQPSTLQIKIDFDETLLDMSTISKTQYKFTPKRNENIDVVITVIVQDIVYKQIKNLITTLRVQKNSPGIPNNYTVYSSEEG